MGVVVGRRRGRRHGRGDGGGGGSGSGSGSEWQWQRDGRWDRIDPPDKENESMLCAFKVGNEHGRQQWHDHAQLCLNDGRQLRCRIDEKKGRKEQQGVIMQDAWAAAVERGGQG